MMPFAGDERPIIQGVEVGERLIQITYVEPRDRGKRVMLARTVGFDIGDVREEFESFEDAARELLDAALLIKRQDER